MSDVLRGRLSDAVHHVTPRGDHESLCHHVHGDDRAAQPPRGGVEDDDQARARSRPRRDRVAARAGARRSSTRRRSRRCSRRSSGTSPTSAVRGALAAAPRRRRAPQDARFDDLYDAFAHSAASAVELPILARSRRARTSPTSGAPRWRCSTRRRSTRATGCSRTASSTAWSCSTSTSTTRRCCPPSSCGSSRTRRPPGPAPVGGAGPADVLVPGGSFVLGAAERALGVRQRARRARGRPAGVPDRPHPGDQRRLPRVRRGRRLRRAELVDRRGLGVARRRERGAPALAGRAAPAAGRGGASAVSSRCRPPSRCSTCAGTRPTPTRGGRASGSRPRPSGRRPTTGRRAGPSELLRRRVGVDGLALPRRYPGFRSFPYDEYSEVFFGDEYSVLRGGSWATDPPSRGRPSATGTTRSAARSSPASAARGTRDRSPLDARPAARPVDVHLADDERHAALRADVRAGLTATPKELPPKYFYDERGSRALRRDHAAARVLPDPRRAGDPRGTAADDRRA